MKILIGLALASSITGYQIPRDTNSLIAHLPRLTRSTVDYDDYDDDLQADSDLPSPGMSPEELRASQEAYNLMKKNEINRGSRPAKVDSFVDNIFDNARAEDEYETFDRGDRNTTVEFDKFIQKNPSGIGSAKPPLNLLTDFYDPVYETGPLVCKKATGDRPSGAAPNDNESPVHIKPIGCCPNNEDGKPFGPGKACCCGHVYNIDTHFCCDKSLGQCTEGQFNIWEDTPRNRKKCWDSTSCDKDIKTNLINMDCSNGMHHGSVCDFTCPSGFALSGIEQASCDPKTGSWNNQWGSLITETPCCKRKCDTKDPNYKLDFFIILDQSSSIGADNFQKMKNFVNNLLLQSNLGQKGVRVGLITYNRRPRLRFHMSEMRSHEEAIAAVDSIVYEGRGTNTGAAIQWVVDNAFKEEYGDRLDVPNKVLLITDGRARDPPVLKVQSKRLQEEATVYALGIGKQIDYVELNRIASPPADRHVLYVDNFAFLERAFGRSEKLKPSETTGVSIFCDQVCLK